MANATAVIHGNTCTITIPPNPSSIVMIPKTSGAAQWVNYCQWTSGLPLLGSWSAHQTSLDIISNPHNLINTTTKHGTMTKTTNPAIAAGTMKLGFTHRVTPTSPLTNDALKLTIEKQSNDITVMTVLAEDGNDHNYLDFQMFITVIDN